MLKLKKHRTFIIAAILSLLLILMAGFVFSQTGGTDLEIDYPIIDGESPTSTKTFLHTYIKYIFNFAILVCGLITLAVIVRAGAQYTASRGNPASLRDARDRIVCGIVGLLILLSSYVILSTINPKLVFFTFNPLTSVSIIPDSIPIISVEATSTAYELPLGALINNKSSLVSSPYSTYEGILNPARLERFEKTGDALERANVQLEILMLPLRDKAKDLRDSGLWLKTQAEGLQARADRCKCSYCHSDCALDCAVSPAAPFGCNCQSCNNGACDAMTACSACANNGNDTCPDRASMNQMRTSLLSLDGIPGTLNLINDLTLTDQESKLDEELRRVRLFSQVIEAFLSKAITVEAFETANSVQINALFDAATKNLISKADRSGMKEIEQDYGNPQEIKEKLAEDIASLEEIELKIKQNPFEIISYYSLLESKDMKYEISQYRGGAVDPGMDPATFYLMVK